MPGSPPRPPGLAGHELPDDVPDPDRPGRPAGPGAPSPGRTVLVATGREDRLRHVVDVAWGEVGDPTALRARCGAPVEAVVPGLNATQADCPRCAAGHPDESDGGPGDRPDDPLRRPVTL